MATEAEKLAVKIFGKKILKLAGLNSGKLNKRYKVVVFLPLEITDKMTFAMASAGAGNIGNYSVCSFRIRGTGSFIGGESSNPVIGDRSKFELADETRLEMICDKENIGNVIDKIYEVHPYDEPAYEVYEVLSGTKRSGAGEILTVNFRKKINAKSVLKKINPSIVLSGIPGKIKNLKLDRCIIDCSGKTETDPENMAYKTIYIKKDKNNIKAYIK